MAELRHLVAAISGKPLDLTNQYNTALSPQQEAAFEAWRAALSPGLQSTRDYDLRAAYVANPEVSANMHLDDVGKKPNHMTFSDGSVHSTPQTPGGSWTQIAPPTPQNPNGQWQFTASPTNLQYHTPDQLLNYFQVWEANKRPDGTYAAPNTVALPKGTQ